MQLGRDGVFHAQRSASVKEILRARIEKHALNSVQCELKTLLGTIEEGQVERRSLSVQVRLDKEVRFLVHFIGVLRLMPGTDSWMLLKEEEE